MRRLRLITVYDKSRLVGVLPLGARVGRLLRSSGVILSDYLDPLVDPGRQPRGAQSLPAPAPSRAVTLYLTAVCGPAAARLKCCRQSQRTAGIGWRRD